MQLNFIISTRGCPSTITACHAPIGCPRACLRERACSDVCAPAVRAPRALRAAHACACPVVLVCVRASPVSSHHHCKRAGRRLPSPLLAFVASVLHCSAHASITVGTAIRSYHCIALAIGVTVLFWLSLASLGTRHSESVACALLSFLV